MEINERKASSIQSKEYHDLMSMKKSWPGPDEELLKDFIGMNRYCKFKLKGVGGEVDPYDISMYDYFFQTYIKEGNVVFIDLGDKKVVYKVKPHSHLITLDLWEANHLRKNPDDVNSGSYPYDCLLIGEESVIREGVRPNHSISDVIEFPPGSSVIIRGPNKYLEIQNPPLEIKAPDATTTESL